MKVHYFIMIFIILLFYYLQGQKVKQVVIYIDIIIFYTCNFNVKINFLYEICFFIDMKIMCLVIYMDDE
ncbi:hypothetical protein ABE79_10415 [Proteus mirabilis]|nr:hypothetical protein ABE79_10415 [Proteus mirabilis]